MFYSRKTLSICCLVIFCLNGAQLQSTKTTTSSGPRQFSEANFCTEGWKSYNVKRNISLNWSLDSFMAISDWTVHNNGSFYVVQKLTQNKPQYNCVPVLEFYSSTGKLIFKKTLKLFNITPVYCTGGSVLMTMDTYGRPVVYVSLYLAFDNEDSENRFEAYLLQLTEKGDTLKYSRFKQGYFNSLSFNKFDSCIYLKSDARIRIYSSNLTLLAKKTLSFEYLNAKLIDNGFYLVASDGFYVLKYNQTSDQMLSENVENSKIFYASLIQNKNHFFELHAIVAKCVMLIEVRDVESYFYRESVSALNLFSLASRSVEVPGSLPSFEKKPSVYSNWLIRSTDDFKIIILDEKDKRLYMLDFI